MSPKRQFAPRGALDPDRDLGVAVRLVLGGTLVPVVVALLTHDVLSLYVTGFAGAAVAATAFGFCLWVVVEWRDLDRPNVAVAVVLVPAALFALVGGGGMAGGFQHVPEAMLHDHPVRGLFQYFGAVAIAGLAAVAVSWRLGRTGHEPDPRRVALGAGTLLLVAVALVVVLNHAATSAATVAAVEPGVADTDYGEPTLDVTVADATGELRVTVVDPTGASVTRRVTRGEAADGPTTLGFRVVDPMARHTPVGSRLGEPTPGVLTKVWGTYRVRVTTLAGVTVDTARYRASPAVQVAVVETASGYGPLDWNRSSSDPDHDLRVGIAVTNHGVFATEVSVAAGVPGEGSVGTDTVGIPPDGTDAIVVGIPEEDAERWRAQGLETVTVTLRRPGYAEGPTSLVVPLPPPEE